MLLLIDENVPDSVAQFLAERGHDVRYVRDLFPRGIPDPIIATLGDQMAAMVVTWDRDFDKFVQRIPEGNKQRFRNLGRISFQCREPRGRALIERWITTIEFHERTCRERGEGRMIITIQESGLKLG
jgi:hypothetical protein